MPATATEPSKEHQQMSAVDHARGADADDVLITRVRGGDLDAYGVLFERHRAAALRLARSLSNGPDADDLVADAFSKVLATLQKGGGPDLAFRAYLLTAVRRLHVDRIRAQSRATPTDDIAALDKGEPFSDTAVAAFENGAAARAFKSLPERWQMVLWHLEVERQKPAEVAPLLGMSPNAVAALAYRAREGLRQAFVQMHAGGERGAASGAAGAAAEVDDECREFREQLGSYVRQGLSRRDTSRVEEHLEGCRACTAVYLELTEVNSSLAAVLGPIVLGSAAAAYLSSTAGGGAAVVGIGVLIGRIRDFVAANTTTVAVGTAATVAVAAGAGAYAANQMHHQSPSANSPVAAASSSPEPSSRDTKTSTDHTRKSSNRTPATSSTPASSPAAPLPTSAASPTQGATHGPTNGPTQEPSGSPSGSYTSTPVGSPTTSHPLALTAPGTATGSVTLRVTGFAADESGTVTLHPSGGRIVSLWRFPDQCGGSAAVISCPVNAAGPTVTVQYFGIVDADLTGTFKAADGVQDSTDNDNTVHVTMHGVVHNDSAGG